MKGHAEIVIITYGLSTLLFFEIIIIKDFPFV